MAYTVQQESAVATQEQFLASCRQQLIEDGLMTCEDGQYFLTAKGRDRVEKELDRYQMMPARLILIQNYILEQHNVAVY